MKRSWVLVANKSSAKIFQKERQKKLTLIEYFSHPEGKLRNHDFNADKMGSSAQGGSYGVQSYVPKVTAKEHETEVFAKELNDFLEKNRHQNNFDELEVMAGPSFIGVLKKHFSKEVLRNVVKFVSKDLINQKEKEILQLIA